MDIKGKKVVLTGTFGSLDRARAKSQLEQLGASVTSAVSKKTELVFAGSKAGASRDKATELGIPVYGEAELLAVVATLPALEEAAWESVALPEGVEQYRPILFTEEEAAIFTDEDRREFVRCADGTLIGRPSGPTIIVRRGGETLEIPHAGALGRIVPSPSGERFVTLSPKREVMEYKLDDQSSTVALPYLARHYYWAVDYLGNDDTLVMLLGDVSSVEWLLLLERNAESGAFEEVDNVKVRGGRDIATSGSVVVLDSKSRKKVTAFGAIDHQLVKLGTLNRPTGPGFLRSHPSDTREHVRIMAGKDAYRVAHLDAMLEGKHAKEGKKVEWILPRNTD